MNSTISCIVALLANSDRLQNSSAPVRKSTMFFTEQELQYAPLVANLSDDNGDGFINEGDIPDVLTMTHNGSSSRLRAYNGLTGARMWDRRNDFGTFDFRLGAPAVGDIDNDGTPEIVIVQGGSLTSGSRRVIIFDHNGLNPKRSPLWPTGITRRAITSIANIDGEGTPEVLVGNVILNGDGTVRCQGSPAQGGGRSVAADLDLDGNLELIVGGAAYRTDCSLVYNTAGVAGWPSIGNLDDDSFPEVVVVNGSKPNLGTRTRWLHQGRSSGCWRGTGNRGSHCGF